MKTQLIIRKCNRCGRTLEANTENFGRNSSLIGGLTYYCRQCTREVSKKWDRKYKEGLRDRKGNVYSRNWKQDS